MEDRRKPYSAGSHRYDHALSEGLYDNPGIFGIRSYLLSVASGNVGKEPVIETDEQMIEGYYRQNQIEMILECALRERSIQVYYQPIYSLKEKELFPSKHWHVCLTGNLDIFHRLNLSRSQKKR